MKVLLYYENYDLITKSGIGRALKLQMNALSSNGVEYTLDPDDTYDIAHINTYWDKSNILINKLKKKNIPVIVHGHTVYEDIRGSFVFWRLFYLWAKPKVLRMYQKADFIISPTKFSSDTIKNYKKVNCEIVPLSNGLDIENYQYSEDKIKQFREYFKFDENKKFIMCVGFPFQRKGFYDFIEIAKKMPDVTFIWFGGLNGLLLPRKNVHYIHHHPSNVIMPGYIDNDIIKGAYLCADAVFFPSYLETEGIVVLEALASKTPLIVRDIPVYKDWLTDNVNCYKGHNNEEFISLIRKVTKEKNTSIIEEGYKVAASRDIHLIGSKLKEYYEYVLANYSKINEKKKNKN